LVTFTGEQARFRRPNAPKNELIRIRQRPWAYPEQAAEASDYLIEEAQRQRDAYFSVHLFRSAGNRRSDNALSEVRCLWLDEDNGRFPETTRPKPTAVVRSSENRRHLYWRLSRPVSVEWAVAMNRRVAYWAGGDAGKAGLATVLRVPGTANFKRIPQVDLVGGHLTGAGAWEPEVIDQAVPELPEPPQASSVVNNYEGPDPELSRFLGGVEVISEVADGVGRKLQIVCPWVHQHSSGDKSGTYVGQRADGGLWFFCNHSHCEARSWREFRSEVRARAKMINIRRGSRKHAKRKEVRVRRG
jgi:hypothetical protein